MSKLILLIVAAAWMAVLLPPLVRTRLDGGSASSVSDFRRQLSSLQRSQAPQAYTPMRAMSRPLAPAPAQRQVRRPAPSQAARGPRLVATDGVLEPDARHRRSHHTAQLPRHHVAAETAYLSPREVVRRRRVNVLYGLVAANILTLFLAFTTGSSMMVYAFSAAFLGLAGYCYVLVQIRNQEYLRRRRHGYRAA
ncbi:MAG: hypothetical protein ACO3RB_01960 [Ilumatobacteraceae bacterium]